MKFKNILKSTEKINGKKWIEFEKNSVQNLEPVFVENYVIFKDFVTKYILSTDEVPSTADDSDEDLVTKF